MVLVKDACEVVSGGTPKTGVADYWDGDIPWATPKDLSGLTQAFISDTPRKLTAAGLASSSAVLLPANSVLLSSRAPIGHVAINAIPMATNQGFKNLIPRPNIAHSGYLYHWLRANRPFLESLGTGATFKEVSKRIVEAVEIPLPPIAEQERIAAALDQVDTLRAKRREAIALLGDLTQSIFLDMFGDPAADSREWFPGAVSDLVAGFESGKSVAPGNDESSQFRVLKASAVTSGEFRGQESKPLPAHYQVPPKHLARKGDLLFSRANTEELIGAVAMVEGEPGNLALPDKLWRFVWPRAGNSYPLYVRHLFRQKEFRRQIRERSSGTSGSMKNISQSNVLGIPCGIPPEELQRKFSERVQHIDRMRFVHRTHLTNLDELFISLQHRAFSGTLWDHEAPGEAA